MAPIIEIKNTNEYERAKKILELSKVNYNIPSLETQTKVKSQEFNKDNSIYVPSLKMYFAKERQHLEKNWYESHKLLQGNNEFMPTIPQFIEFLKYLKSSKNQEYLEVYKNITEVRSPWRGEWLDADFRVIDDKLHIDYNHKLDSNGSLIPKNSEVLDKNTLMKDKTPGISLENWMDNSTEQGLPSKHFKKGDLYYWCSRGDNNSFAGFIAFSDGAGLSWGGYPSGQGCDIGVRAVRHE